MRKSTKIWLIAAGCLLLIGCVILGGGMSMLKWNAGRLVSNQYETNRHEIEESFTNISIAASTADLVFEASENDGCSVVCYERKNGIHAVSVSDDTLTIQLRDTRRWYEHLVDFGTPKITVYLPRGEWGALTVTSSTGKVEIPEDFAFASIDISQSTGDVTNRASVSEGVKIKTTTGDICVENISAGSLDLSLSTGKMTVSGVSCVGDIGLSVSTGKSQLSDIACKNMVTGGDTGGISLHNVIAAEKLSVVRTTGDVKLEGVDAAEILVETDTGDVSGTLRSEKVFAVRTSTGRIRVPDTANGGRCQITTSTGDIEISIQEP